MEPEKKSHGALIGSIIIVLILIIGGIYVWQQKKNNVELNQIKEEQQTVKEVNSLEDEINETDTDVNVDLSGIE
ncbi:MAG TPA: hypothetical protein PLO44_01310 [Candidatus Paceibacterota bacterium]|nr:hypothetical protein [Candidatus Paceibacterota bacterium]